MLDLAGVVVVELDDRLVVHGPEYPVDGTRNLAWSASGRLGTVHGMNEARTYRVTVRGRFDGLSDRARTYLQGARAEHDIFVSAYTAEGSLTYDDRLDFFNLRYECRADDADIAGLECLEEAIRFLDTMGFGHRDLKVNIADLSAMWDEASRRNRRDRRG